MRTFTHHVRHSFSCLLDQKFEVQVDDEAKTVTIFEKTFDSHLISRVQVDQLPAEGVVAFLDDDTRGEHVLGPPYVLQIRIGGGNGVIFNARAVRLATAAHKGNGLAITLQQTQGD